MINAYRKLTQILIFFTLCFLIPGNPLAEKNELNRLKEEINSFKQNKKNPAIVHEIKNAQKLINLIEQMESSGTKLTDEYIDLLKSQTELIKLIKKAGELEKKLSEKEKQAYELKLEVDEQKAAYEYFVDQILASGLTSLWAEP